MANRYERKKARIRVPSNPPKAELVLKRAKTPPYMVFVGGLWWIWVGNSYRRIVDCECL